MIDTKELSRQKVIRMLQAVEASRNLLIDASDEISDVLWTSDQRDLLIKHYDTLSELWHELNRTILWSKIDMDSDVKARIAEQNRKASLAGGFQSNSPWTRYLLDIERAKANGEIAPSYEEWTARQEASSVEKHEPTRLISEKEER